MSQLTARHGEPTFHGRQWNLRLGQDSDKMSEAGITPSMGDANDRLGPPRIARRPVDAFGRLTRQRSRGTAGRRQRLSCARRRGSGVRTIFRTLESAHRQPGHSSRGDDVSAYRPPRLLRRKPSPTPTKPPSFCPASLIGGPPEPRSRALGRPLCPVLPGFPQRVPELHRDVPPGTLESLGFGRRNCLPVAWLPPCRMLLSVTAGADEGE